MNLNLNLNLPKELSEKLDRSLKQQAVNQISECQPFSRQVPSLDGIAIDLPTLSDLVFQGNQNAPVQGIIAAESTIGPSWAMYRGDCCEVSRSIPTASIDMSIHSPPFSNLYIYSDSEADMGNCADNEEFFAHYRYIIREMRRITISGRIAVVHCKDLPKYANRDGTAGLIDFPGMIIAAYEAEGWSFHSRVTIWKCPVTERERTNNNGLLHKTACRDRSQLRQGMADYLLVFRNPPEGTLMSPKPVVGHIKDHDGKVLKTGFVESYIGDLSPRENHKHPSKYARKGNATDLSIDIWRRYAEPVWFDINQQDVLNVDPARGNQDERHICPLQVDLIRRCVQIWSNPGDVVFSPFAGIGSEGYGSILEERKFLGVELKKEYFDVACGNLRKAEEKMRQGRLF